MIMNNIFTTFQYVQKILTSILLLLGISVSGECQENTKQFSMEEMIKFGIQDIRSDSYEWLKKLNSEFHDDWKSVLIQMWKDNKLNWDAKNSSLTAPLMTQSHSLNDILLILLGCLDDDRSISTVALLRLATLKGKNVLFPTLRKYVSIDDVNVEIQKQISSELDDILNYKFPSTVGTRTKDGSLCSYVPEYWELTSNFYKKWKGQWQKLVLKKWDDFTTDNKKRISGFFYSLSDTSHKLIDSSFNADMILRIYYLLDDDPSVFVTFVYEQTSSLEIQKAFIEGIYQLSKTPNKPPIKVNIESPKP